MESRDTHWAPAVSTGIRAARPMCPCCRESFPAREGSAVPLPPSDSPEPALPWRWQKVFLKSADVAVTLILCALLKLGPRQSGPPVAHSGRTEAYVEGGVSFTHC